VWVKECEGPQTRLEITAFDIGVLFRKREVVGSADFLPQREIFRTFRLKCTSNHDKVRYQDDGINVSGRIWISTLLWTVAGLRKTVSPAG
jgi:hypothetical protein